MTEIQLPTVPIRRGRVIALIVAAAMLNVGLYFLLYIFTPIVSGFVVGFLIGRKKEGGVLGFIGSFVAFLPMLIAIAPILIDGMIAAGEILASEVPALLPWIYTQLIISALILSVLGLIGGIIGGFLGQSAMK